MKKILLLLAVLICSSLSLKAQFYIGPKMGVNIAKVPTTETNLPEGNKQYNKNGLNVGIAIQYQFTPMFSAYSEILFSQKGYKDQWMENDTLKIKREENLTANYFELPLIARLTFGKGDVKVYVNLGPSIGYWVSGKFASLTVDDYNEEKIDFKKLEDAKRFEVSANAGLGFLLAAGGGNIFLDARYSYGVTPSMQGEDKDGREYQWKNVVVGLTAGYLFKF